ncbi:hypothetical protein [Nocardiopsis sp. YSL2]|uniref:hypothetical protein n=1 Tax=Nocardiopsis sp. YSL2 TaxID=2939492 RepID=UPI0026F41C1A|nr:hypothetical protein [Nocardiopsis sp. YSL2]
MSTIVPTPEGELRIERDFVDVTVAAEPDPNWVYTDQHGHEHRYHPGEGDHYPTLVTVMDEPYWCPDCEEEHQFDHLECRLCGEQISPGIRPGTPRKVPGMWAAYLNDEPISGEHADALLAAARESRGRP